MSSQVSSTDGLDVLLPFPSFVISPFPEKGNKPIASRFVTEVDETEVELSFYAPVVPADPGRVDKEELLVPFSRFYYASAILLCFSVDNPTSLLNIERYWTPLIRRRSLRLRGYCPPFLSLILPHLIPWQFILLISFELIC